MKREIVKLFPEIDDIKDENLQKGVIATFAEAIEIGGWTPFELCKIPFTLLLENGEVDFVDHTRVVTNIAIKAADLIGSFHQSQPIIDRDLIIAGGLLHDVGKLIEIEKDKDGFKKSKNGKLLRHPFIGASLAYKNGLPISICHIIAVHSKEGDGGYRSPEATIVHHADFMAFESLV